MTVMRDDDANRPAARSPGDVESTDVPARASDERSLRSAQASMTPTGTATAMRPDDDAVGSGRVRMQVFRGEGDGPTRFDEFDVPVEEGMVVLDALHWIQGHVAPDLAVRWNCKAAKCGSCGAEVNGRPRLTCKTRLSDFEPGEEITVEPMRTFPLIRDLVTDVSWNYAANKSIEPFKPPADVPQSEWRWQQEDIERVQEFRKCIECFLCQDVCHVLRNHETDKPFMGPRYLVRAAGLEMHPIDQADRRPYLKDAGSIGYCNITKCCTEVCPEHIKITDNAIIPLKERVADEFYDPIQWAWRKLRGRSGDATVRADLPVLPAGSAASTTARPGRDAVAQDARGTGDAESAQPMEAPEGALPAPPERGTTQPKPPARRSDAGDETPSEG
jgi:succinate dehydrogenase / fumarate reductase iron-sulfur subunit